MEEEEEEENSLAVRSRTLDIILLKFAGARVC